MDPAKLKPAQKTTNANTPAVSVTRTPSKSFEATLAERTRTPKRTEVGAKSTILAAIEQAAGTDQDAQSLADAKEQLGLTLARGILSNPKAGSIDMDQPANPEDDD